jgi:Uma2 family endonuclease
MAANPQYPTMSLDAYFAMEHQSSIRHEYDQGLVYAMTGASEDHLTMTLNIGASLNGQFKKRDCKAFVEGMRVGIVGKQAYYYPDVVALCGEREYGPHDDPVLINPMILVEVLSPSTEQYDKTRKLEVYQSIPTLTDCLLVRQDRIHITHYSRQGVKWISAEYNALTDEITLSSINATLLVSDVYDKVSWNSED